MEAGLSRRQLVFMTFAATGAGLSVWPSEASAQAAWLRQPPENRPVATPVPDAFSIDHAQVTDPFSPRTFAVDEAVFRRMLQASAIDPDRLGARVLFGLRGCTLTEDAARPDGSAVPQLTLAEAQIDHQAFRCVMGVWIKGAGFWASTASTVPHVAYLYAQQRAVKAGRESQARTICNQMASGVYKYKVGSHRNWSRIVQPGAFRQASFLPVVRNLDPAVLGIRRTGTWSFEGPALGENIHAATGDGHVPYYAAGCQVIPGHYSNSRMVPEGNWRAFRVAAGLSPEPVVIWQVSEDADCAETLDDATPSCSPPFNEVISDLAQGAGLFDYVLICGRELRMAAEHEDIHRDPAHRRLRRGSTGPEVSRLQALMNRSAESGHAPLGETGFLDSETQRRLIFGWQLPATGGADGILSRAEGFRLGFSGVFS